MLAAKRRQRFGNSRIAVAARKERNFKERQRGLGKETCEACDYSCLYDGPRAPEKC